MATIFYSMAGEGRGHATRARTVTEALRARHSVTILAPGDAYAFLEPAYRGTEVRVLRIPGLRFVYDSRQRVHNLRTGVAAWHYLTGLPNLTRDLADLFRHHGADLAVTDFDPSAPRAARRIGLPYVALDHQSFLWAADLSFLPRDLRLHARVMSLLIRGYYKRQVHTISSSFFRPEPRPGVREVTFVGSMLRPALLAAETATGDHVTAYLRRSMPANVLEALRAAPCPVHVFGQGERPDDGSLRFHAISEDGFLRSLATCRAVVATAGNQLLGEVRWLGKPVLALPEAKQQEQRINGCFLERDGGGEWCPPVALDAARVAAFLERAPTLVPEIDRDFAAGNDAAVAAVEAVLERIGAGDAAPAPRPEPARA